MEVHIALRQELFGDREFASAHQLIDAGGGVCQRLSPAVKDLGHVGSCGYGERFGVAQQRPQCLLPPAVLNAAFGPVTDASGVPRQALVVGQAEAAEEMVDAERASSTLLGVSLPLIRILV